MKNLLIVLMFIISNRLYSNKSDVASFMVSSGKVCNEDLYTYDKISTKIAEYNINSFVDDSHELLKFACLVKIHCLANDLAMSNELIKKLNLPNTYTRRGHSINSCISDIEIFTDFIEKIAKSNDQNYGVIYTNLMTSGSSNTILDMEKISARTEFLKQFKSLFEASINNIKDIAPNAVTAIAEYISSGVSEDALKILVEENELEIALSLDEVITKLAEKTELASNKEDLNNIYEKVYKDSKKTDRTFDFDVDKFKAAINPIIENHTETNKHDLTKKFKRIFDVIAILDNKINPINSIKTNLEIIKVISDLFKNLSPAVNPPLASTEVDTNAVNDFNKYVKDELTRDGINKYFVDGPDQLDKNKVDLEEYMKELGKANTANQELINKIYNAFKDASGNDDTLKTKLAEIVTTNDRYLAEKILTIIYALDKLNKSQTVELNNIESNVRSLIAEALNRVSNEPPVVNSGTQEQTQQEVAFQPFDIIYTDPEAYDFNKTPSQRAYASHGAYLRTFNKFFRNQFPTYNMPVSSKDANGNEVVWGMGRPQGFFKINYVNPNTRFNLFPLNGTKYDNINYNDFARGNNFGFGLFRHRS